MNIQPLDNSPRIHEIDEQIAKLAGERMELLMRQKRWLASESEDRILGLIRDYTEMRFRMTAGVDAEIAALHAVLPPPPIFVTAALAQQLRSDDCER